jgi:hypothetical protein
MAPSGTDPGEGAVFSATYGPSGMETSWRTAAACSPQADHHEPTPGAKSSAAIDSGRFIDPSLVIDSSQFIDPVPIDTNQACHSPKPREWASEYEMFLGLRRLLYADFSLAEELQEIPGSSNTIGEAIRRKQAGDLDGARAISRSLADCYLDPNESRAINQIWCFLRELGEEPQGPDADQVLGVVVEMHPGSTAIVVAAYAVGAPRIFLSTGGGMIGRRLSTAITEAGRTLLRCAEDGAREIPFQVDLELPGPGMVRLTLLTRRGARSVVDSIEVLEQPSSSLHTTYLAAQTLHHTFLTCMYRMQTDNGIEECLIEYL